jgi:hypothetical protein
MSRVICALFLFLARTAARAEGQPPDQIPEGLKKCLELEAMQKWQEEDLKKWREELEEQRKRDKVWRRVVMGVIVLVVACGGLISRLKERKGGEKKP